MSEGLTKGWISIHRKVFSNPILKPKSNHKWSILEVWFWFCAKASYERQKVVLGNDIFWIEAGQMITSQEKLRERFNWSKTKLRNKLKLMEKDEMIKVQASKKMTMITLLNYEPYQNRETKEKPKKNHKKTHSNKENKDNKTSMNISVQNSIKFSTWWKLYSYSKNKPRTIIQWNKIIKPKLNLIDVEFEKDEFFTQLINHTKSYVKETPEKRYRLHPERYIKYNTFEDEVVKTETKNKYKLKDYKHDKTGFPMAYCEACGKYDTYYKEEIKRGSKCCNNADLVPHKPKEIT